MHARRRLTILVGVALLTGCVLAALLTSWRSRLRPEPVLTCVDASGDAGAPEACNPDHFQHGDLLFLEGTSLRTHAVLQVDRTSPYSHVGIVHRRGLLVHLLHASPEAADTSPPRVRLEPIDRVLRNSVQAALYRPHFDAAQIEVAVHQGLSYLDLPFDGDLDLDDAHAIYCTELVWRAWRAAGVELLPDGPAAVETPFGDAAYALPSQFLASSHFEAVTHLLP